MNGIHLTDRDLGFIAMLLAREEADGRYGADRKLAGNILKKMSDQYEGNPSKVSPNCPLCGKPMTMGSETRTFGRPGREITARVAYCEPDEVEAWVIGEDVLSFSSGKPIKVRRARST